MKLLAYTVLSLTIVLYSCDRGIGDESSTTEATPKPLPHFKYQMQSVFPGNGSLLRAEDGVALGDGRIIVVDQASGLRLVEQDGSNRPFGDFTSAGFVHDPPEVVAAPNGIFLEHNGQHVIMSDVADGKIYRVHIPTEEVKMIYDHPFGVNTIYRDQKLI
jgi:sugar lactone lactonase YvrE